MNAAHGHDHGPGGHHNHPHEHEHEHGHQHRSGFSGWLSELFVPHTHDPADSIDDALESNVQGIRALKISLAILLGTTVLQFTVVGFSGSVALLADTIHNFSDALTAVPLWIAFILGRRAATRRYTFGYGRAEDLAGLFIVVVVALSAVLAAWQSIDRLIHPQPLAHLGWVLAAGVVGFIGNEAVAMYRIKIGRRIGSAALVADGIHARTDGFTSLAVVLGAGGAMLGFPLADPIVGLLICAAIIVLLIGTIRSIGRRLMDGIEPDLLAKAEEAFASVPGIVETPRLQLRWVGHRLHCTAVVLVRDAALSEVEATLGEARAAVSRALPKLDDLLIQTGTRRLDALGEGVDSGLVRESGS
ncbi:cation transporter [Arthrobacter sp. AQ5-05]|uniref:cation diffusion facilitator family transporter n=1 Tax=Arthrobacter sp. AQ5-05 TaxID=2184581 RepID=UPI000DCC5A1F|nr:cation diffusion facilitator family transporter [Arthrobacter sp. AQ5-05]RAX46919.1 cation transporter [Arthrobacter sp. AQ5-05]